MCYPSCHKPAINKLLQGCYKPVTGLLHGWLFYIEMLENILGPKFFTATQYTSVQNNLRIQLIAFCVITKSPRRCYPSPGAEASIEHILATFGQRKQTVWTCASYCRPFFDRLIWVLHMIWKHYQCHSKINVQVCSYWHKGSVQISSFFPLCKFAHLSLAQFMRRILRGTPCAQTAYMLQKRKPYMCDSSMNTPWYC